MEKENLLNYAKYQPSKSCYLDGRYFNKVLKKYPGLMKNPLYIHIDENGVYMQMVNTLYSQDHLGLLRVVITSKNMRHSMLVVFNHDTKEAWIYDPNRENSPKTHDLIIEHIIEYLSKILDYEYFDVQLPAPKKDNLKQCKQSGVCNALVLLQAYKLINGEEFTDYDIKNVRRFMTAVENSYSLPKNTLPEPEYDLTSGQVIGTTTGAIGGAIIGGSVAGVPGLLVGSAIGGLGGFAIGSAVS